MGEHDLGWSNSAHASRDTLPVAMGEGPASALSFPPKIAMRKMKEQFFPVFLQAFQVTNSNTILFERGFEDLGHPQCLMAFPGTEDTYSGDPLSVSLSPVSLSWDSQSEPSCEAAGARGGTGRWDAASRGRVQTYATVNAKFFPTAKRPQIIICPCSAEWAGTL